MFRCGGIGTSHAPSSTSPSQTSPRFYRVLRRAKRGADRSRWIDDLSPFQHVPEYPASDLRVFPLALLVAIAGGLTALGLAGLLRRDIG